MQKIENKKIKEKIYIEKLKNGLNVIVIPKKQINKKETATRKLNWRIWFAAS